jgi:hypothetical protein
MTTKSFEAASDALLEEYLDILLCRVEEYMEITRHAPPPQDVEKLGGRLAEAEGRLAELRRQRAN